MKKMERIHKEDVEDVVSTIKTVMEKNDGKLPAKLYIECREGLSKASPSVVMAFYRELTAKCPAALKYF